MPLAALSIVSMKKKWYDNPCKNTSFNEVKAQV